MITVAAVCTAAGLFVGFIFGREWQRVDALTDDMRPYQGDPYAFDHLFNDAARAFRQPPPFEPPATERIQLPPTQAITPTRLICAEGRPCMRHSPALCMREIPCCPTCSVA